MTIVSDTSPISNLAKVGQIELLQQLYKTVLIPTAVYNELLDERAGEVVIAAVQAAPWLIVQPIKNKTSVEGLRSLLDLGEAEAIALAIEVNATRLLIDERLGRQAATEQGLRMIGVAGILLLAKQKGLIAVVKPILDDLAVKAKFRVSSQLYADVLRAAKE